MHRCFVRENSFIARIAAWKLGARSVAIVLGSTIHLHNTRYREFLNNQRWVRHELKHIEQFERYGWVNFVFRYLVESVRNGYYNNHFEREAREEENKPGIESSYLILQRKKIISRAR